MTTQLTKSPKQLPPFDPSSLGFGKYSSDHMVSISSEYSGQQVWKWQAPKIIPFQPLQIDPFNSSLHYAIQCFEGMKAYKTKEGKIILFRPECNMKRLKLSSQRVTLPDFDGNELIKCIEDLVRLQQKWIPAIRQFSLYLRPFHISMQNSLGVKEPRKAQLLVLGSPAGPYYSTGFKPNSLSCSLKTVRSCHGGTGNFKLGGNYAPTLRDSHEANKRNYQQILWLYGEDEQVVEVGASNIFFVFKTANSNVKEIVTPDLEDLVLPGVTRDSILQLMGSKSEFKVSERKITIKEVLDRLQKKQLLECFGAGTAVIVGPVDKIEYKGKEYEVPINKDLNAGDVTYQVRNEILDIQNGNAKDIFGWTRVIN